VEPAFLQTSFFNAPAAKVARAMVGKTLVRILGGVERRFTVVETEAYEGQDDLACHSAKGRTQRTEVMFGPAGRFYVYRIYGLHWMLNIVTGDIDQAAAILIRGLEGISGPGRVAVALDVDSSLTGLEAVPAAGLWFEDAVPSLNKLRVLSTPRIGVDYAGPVWAPKKLRFIAAR
jgi:DNA-3-methyladenine glycosylase